MRDRFFHKKLLILMKKINFLCQANPGEDIYNFSKAYKVNQAEK